MTDLTCPGQPGAMAHLCPKCRVHNGIGANGECVEYRSRRRTDVMCAHCHGRRSRSQGMFDLLP